jgi:N-acetylmuramoyl-L-alanine amidase
MKRASWFSGEFPSARPGIALSAAAACLLCLALPARADKKSEAREQFEHAVELRTQLEGYPEKNRSLVNYRETVSAYHKVYLISAQSEEVTPALIAEGHLYREMGRLYDPKYFASAISAYNFLLKQYPGSQYRGEALFTIAQIQKDDLGKSDEAVASFQEYLKRFPRSERASEARTALKQIADAKAAPAPQVASSQPVPAAAVASATAPSSVASSDIAELPDIPGKHVDPQLAANGTPAVKNVQTWNRQDATRIIVALDGTIKYDAVRIASPDRIYFDLYKARLIPKLANKTWTIDSGLLKSLRLAQNKQGVVRLVLDVDGAKNYSAFLVANPYRLVIDVRSPGATAPVTTAKNIAAPSSIGPPAASSVPSAKSAATLASNIDKPAPVASESVSVSANSKPASHAIAANHKDTATAIARMNTLAPKTAPKLPPAKVSAPKVADLVPPSMPKPTRDGQRSLTRALGLKISRIVIDAGHGGHDTGTIGPHGLMEKDLCLDVALRLGKMIEDKLPGAEVVYTRKDDTFIPLEQRTAIANEAKADLFISIHANSSHDPDARGIETYYLNFANSEDSMEVAARENAEAQESLHDLQDLVKKIARSEKIEESKELAGDIQDTLTQRLQMVSRSERNRGVKRAPFVVLIGADMPSVLSEISFVSNPNDEKLLRKTDQRQRIADGLYRGIASYLNSLNSLGVNQKLLSEDHDGPDTHSDAHPGRFARTALASTGNPK